MGRWGPRLRPSKRRGQMGLEPTPDEFVAGMVEVFREVRRVLRDDGTLWLNIGDSYSGSGKGGNPEAGKQATNKGSQSVGVLYGKTGETARQAAVTNVTRDVHGIAQRTSSAFRGCSPSPFARTVGICARTSSGRSRTHAGERARPLHQGARISVPAVKEPTLLFRRRGDSRARYRAASRARTASGFKNPMNGAESTPPIQIFAANVRAGTSAVTMDLTLSGTR
jgi:hypothetical protein